MALDKDQPKMKIVVEWICRFVLMEKSRTTPKQAAISERVFSRAGTIEVLFKNCSKEVRVDVEELAVVHS